MMWEELFVFLSRFDGRNQHDPNACTSFPQHIVFRFADIVCSVQKLKPIPRLVCFLQCDLELGDKIRSAMCILRLVDIGTDGCPASSDLIGDDGFLLRF